MMEAFLSRKKRKLSPPPPQVHDAGDDEPTEVKLAMLSSLHPALEQEILLDVLLAHDGSVSAASASLAATTSPAKKQRPSGVMGAQTSLKQFATVSQPHSPKKPRLLSKKGTTLHLYSPEDIAQHTPCSIIHNFLPPDEADSLLLELLEESKTFEKITFKLFDTVVTSPHTSGFYVGTASELDSQKTDYVYNGARLTDVRQITPQLDRVKARVQEAVNAEIQTRIRTRYRDGKKLRFQSPRPWCPNAAFVNCYAGPQQSVGWHSDQLTYLGPRAVIGSLSLGVAREFRVRRVVPKDDDERDDKGGGKATSSTDPDAEGQIAIHLPHNSLLVMHAEMQEEWKHSVAPARAIDPHPLAGNRRINVTYRDYRPEFHPRFTPRCRCGVPGVLRVVQRKRESWGRYFWMCHAGNVPGKEGCSFFQWAEFDDDGVPVKTG
jgi:alkylated DNA repair dioxygenase AlkB